MRQEKFTVKNYEGGKEGRKEGRRERNRKK